MGSEKLGRAIREALSIKEKERKIYELINEFIKEITDNDAGFTCLHIYNDPNESILYINTEDRELELLGYYDFTNPTELLWFYNKLKKDDKSILNALKFLEWARDVLDRFIKCIKELMVVS